MIPFNVPFISDNSKKYVIESLNSSFHHGDGPYSNLASNKLTKLVGGGHVLLTPSCTHALEMASMLINLGPGDEVILPSYTFTSAATAITKFGAIPVFVDVGSDTKCINVDQARQAITPRTKAISWVNYAGDSPDIDALLTLRNEFGFALIEDNAHGLGGSYKGKPLGSFGDFAVQSFHATKNIQCGEGGALIINNSKFIERAEIIREKGTDRKKFVNGEVKKYQWVDQGSSYLLAEPLAAILMGQLENFTSIQYMRAQVIQKYRTIDFAENIFTKQKFFSDAHHMFYIEFKNSNDLKVVKDKLKELGINTAMHYESLHTSKFGSKFKNKIIGPNSNSVKISSNLLRLPLWAGLTELECQEVIKKLEIVVTRFR